MIEARVERFILWILQGLVGVSYLALGLALFIKAAWRPLLGFAALAVAYTIWG